ncbi:MAG: LytR C-terminal domain-containing protein [Actinomycetota bacterium]|nr:LytR C-terminal domain-containing protein [Actinomycetota bacterium]
MTLAPPESSGESAAADAGGADGDIRPVVRQRVATRKKRRRRAVAVQTVLTVVSVVLLAGLGVVGYRSTLKITGGRESEVTDPAAPNYVAEVRPTSVRLVAVTGGPWRDDTPADQVLGAAMLVIENGPDDVQVVPVSPSMTLGQFEDAPPASAETVFAEGGIDVLQVRLGAELTFGPTSTLSVTAAALEALAGQVGPITFQNSDAVTLATFSSEIIVEYPAGELTLEPTQVAEFLTVPGYMEDGSSRSLRTAAVWNELLRLLAERGGPDEITGVEGEGVEEFSELIATFAATEVRFDLLPLVPVPDPIDPAVMSQGVDAASMPDWVSQHVSFPTSAFPGQRPTVALLNGTTDDQAARALAPRIVVAGGEVALLGNAESFDLATSSVEYSTPEAKAAAEQIAAELGLSATSVEPSPNNVDVEVRVGKDLAP